MSGSPVCVYHRKDGKIKKSYRALMIEQKGIHTKIGLTVGFLSLLRWGTVYNCAVWCREAYRSSLEEKAC